MRIRYSLEWLESSAARRDLTPGTYLIGRGAENDIVIDAQGVSRSHAELVICRDRGLLLRDRGSTNGSRIDGQRIAEYACNGDVDLLIGSAKLRLRERQVGLDDLAFATAQGEHVGSTAAATASPTASVDLARELRALAAALRPAECWTAASLSLLLTAWAECLGIKRLRLCDANGAIWAIAGPAVEAKLVEVIVAGPWRLQADPLSASAQRALAAIAEDLILFAPRPAPDPLPAAAVATTPVEWPGLPSSSPAMRLVLRQLQRAAGATIPILLLGETGVGKELIAHWLHRNSACAAGPFLALNCAALPKDLLEAELFGVEKGAATGVTERPGLLERADGGTLFLDEVGDTAAETQVRLLRVLEDGRITRVGGRGTLAVNVRLVAATNRDLEAEIAAGRFRLDLYHRLAGFAARIPPLRERPEDIAPLAIHFYREALARMGGRSKGITAAALLSLQRWHWPGNVRELRQTIEGALIVLDEGEALDRSHLPEGLRGGVSDRSALTLAAAIDAAEREAMVTALALSGGDHDGAWTLLGIGKTTFYKKLRRHALGRGKDDLTET